MLLKTGFIRCLLKQQCVTAHASCLADVHMGGGGGRNHLKSFPHFLASLEGAVFYPHPVLRNVFAVLCVSHQLEKILLLVVLLPPTLSGRAAASATANIYLSLSFWLPKAAGGIKAPSLPPFTE